MRLEVVSASQTAQRSSTVKTQTPEQFIVSQKAGNNHRLMPPIWCAPQVPLCQSQIYTVLKLPWEKQTNQVWGLDAQCNDSY